MGRQSNSGFISLDRKFLKWELWKDPVASRLFLYLLLKANWKDEYDEKTGVLVPRGSAKLSLQEICDETGLSIQNIRTAIKNLKLTESLTESLTEKTKATIRILTVVKYDEYQRHNRITNRITNTSSYYKNNIITNNIVSDSQDDNAPPFESAAQSSGHGDEVE